MFCFSILIHNIWVPNWLRKGRRLIFPFLFSLCSPWCRRNYRATWNLSQTEPVAGNYYPVNSRIYIKVMAPLAPRDGPTCRSTNPHSVIVGYVGTGAPLSPVKVWGKGGGRGLWVVFKCVGNGG